MIKKCVGCGSILQDNNPLLEGYTNVLTNDLCKRCFRMKHYGDYEFVIKDNKEYINILKNIKNKSCLVLYIVDLLVIPENVTKIKEYIKDNKIILVLNKKDILPLSVKDEKLIEYFKKFNIFSDIIVISANKNYNLDLLYNKINLSVVNNLVYVIGNTNAGKSTLINKLINNYSIDSKSEITISPMPSTTLNEIEIKLNKFTLVDTPGLVDDGNILNYVTEDMVKRIIPKKEISPRTYQLKNKESLIIENLFRIDYNEDYKNSFTFFISNDIDIKKISSKKNTELKDKDVKNIKIGVREDICINGLGFIKVVDPCNITIYIDKNIDIYKRKSLI